MSERIEHDSMGEVRVPADALWGAQTARAVENFPISGLTMPAGDRARPGPGQGRRRPGERRAGRPGRRRARPRSRRRRGRSPRGRHDDQFPIDVFQTGSGTSTNMNVNEVVARLAHLQTGAGRPPQRPRQRRPVHQRHLPHRASALAATTGRGAASWRRRWRTWQASLRRKEAEFADVVKAGRTHLMDAVPVTLGQEFSGYARQVELGPGAGAAGRRRAPPSCRWAARPPAPASTPPRGSPPR